MKRIALLSGMFLAAATFASAQIIVQTNDVLGAHLNYGRGCAACHAPHSGANGNGINKSGDTTTGNSALWGEDVGNLYGKTIVTGQMDNGATFSETLPSSLTATTPDVMGVLTCLSCHDGNYAVGAMMKNTVYESLPSTYGTSNTIPTLLGADGTTTGNYLNDHPVGLNAAMSCTGQYNWDCTISNGSVLMNGANSSKFVTNYGFFVSPGNNAGTPVVLCTTCHNQHVMNIVKVTTGPKSGLPTGTYATMFFLRGPYNPADPNTATNQTAQFCRQCHGGESNEANGSTAGTVF
ncbi:MAG TPA: hypothetical protein VIY53_08295 [Acidobacteriaceae bacterium]